MTGEIIAWVDGTGFAVGRLQLSNARVFGVWNAGENVKGPMVFARDRETQQLWRVRFTKPSVTQDAVIDAIVAYCEQTECPMPGVLDLGTHVELL